MDQDTLWLIKYNEVKIFIETNQRNPSRYDDEEDGEDGKRLRHIRKLYAAGEMKGEKSGAVWKAHGNDRTVLEEKPILITSKSKKVFNTV